MVRSHWIEQLADKVIEEKKEPYVVTSGITTSGPAHLGTLCEFLYPSKIADMLKEKGKEVEFYFMGDILDAFDSIPVVMQKYESQLKPHLGKPLCNVPDPTGRSKSFGDYFFDEVKEIMKKFGIKAKTIRVNELYEKGMFDDIARFYLKNKEKVRKILEEVTKKDQSNFHPLMPICKNCGRIATTRVISDDGENYEYVCDKDVGYTKGCGYKGKDNIKNHNYKLAWRLHWPAWQKIFHTSIEGAGVDHHTRGGSWDSTVRIHKELFNEDPPIGFKFGFILLNGKKYSKSKGIGMGLYELMKLLPPEVITFILIRPDLEENKNIVPTKKSMLRMVEEYEQSKIFYEKKERSKAEEKRALAYHFAGKKHWNGHFRDVLLYYSIYQDWDKVVSLLDESVLYLKPYIEEWRARDLIPEEYDFRYAPKKAEGLVKEFFELIPNNADALNIHNQVFEFAKSHNIQPKDMFKMIYRTLIGKEKGPRLGRLVYVLGIERVKKDVL